MSATNENGDDISEQITAEFEAFVRATRLDQIAPDRVSVLFVLSLFGATKAGRANPFRVAQEIETLEQGAPNGLKPPIQNRFPPLKGLWHKHYMQSDLRAMALNVKHGLRDYGIPYLQQKVNEAAESGELRYFTVEDAIPIANDAVQGNLERLRQAEGLTGEWIVFAKHEGQNYYLALATHDKTTHDSLRHQIDAICCREFPFLGKLLAAYVDLEIGRSPG